MTYCTERTDTSIAIKVKLCFHFEGRVTKADSCTAMSVTRLRGCELFLDNEVSEVMRATRTKGLQMRCEKLLEYDYSFLKN